MKVAFTGSHGTGKTTSVFQLAQEMKIKYPNKTVGVFHENAKFSPFAINKKTTIESQLWIFSNQLQEELSLSTKYDILVCDRTIVDAIGYSKTVGFHNLVKVMVEMAKFHIHTYDEIYFKTIENNNFVFPDGVRDATDLNYRKEVENNMIDMYKLVLEDMNKLIFM